MSQKERKYTVYEIEKLTHGRLTKYKLTKAILAGELKAQEVKEKKRGRGIPNFFIYEDDLNVYLKKLEENKKHFINVPEADESFVKKSSKNEQEIVDFLKIVVEKLENIERKVELLDENFLSIIPLLDSGDVSEHTEEKRREMIEEIASMPSFMIKKRKDLLSKLKNIG